MKRLGMVALAALLLPATTVAQGQKQPSAIVEDVTDGIPGVALMDYLAPGKVVQLGANGKLVLGYLQSCTR